MAAMLSLGVLAVIPAATSFATVTTSMTKDQWVQTMNQTPTPGIGCWTASYPSTAWIQTQCASAEVGPFTAAKLTPSLTLITLIESLALVFASVVVVKSEATGRISRALQSLVRSSPNE